MIRIKEWSSYQSYKDRNPPWIRLHKKLIDNYKFQKMSVEARALLPMLWLLAAEDKDPVSGMIRLDHEEVAFRLRQDPITVKMACDEIRRNDFIEYVVEGETDLFSTSYGTVTEPLRIYHPEAEADTESEISLPNGNDSTKPKGNKIPKPDDVDQVVWDDFDRLRKQHKAPLTHTALDGIRKEASKAGVSLNDALKECCARGWRGFKAEWVNKNNQRGNANERNNQNQPTKSERALSSALKGIS